MHVDSIRRFAIAAPYISKHLFSSQCRFRTLLLSSFRCCAIAIQCFSFRFNSLPLLFLSNFAFRCLCVAIQLPFHQCLAVAYRGDSIRFLAFAALLGSIRSSRRDASALRFEVTQFSAFPPQCFSKECRHLLSLAYHLCALPLLCVPIRVFSVPFLCDDEPVSSALCLCTTNPV